MFLNRFSSVATVLTVYGIETASILSRTGCNLGDLVATVLTVYGIETMWAGTCRRTIFMLQQYLPFTVLKLTISRNNSIESDTLQQYLPFTVLKPTILVSIDYDAIKLQQYLPFTVLKR